MASLIEQIPSKGIPSGFGRFFIGVKSFWPETLPV